MERRAGSRSRAALAALGVSTARLRSQPLRPVLVLSGVALAFAMTVAIVGGSLVARQQALSRALEALPGNAQGFRVDRFGLPLNERTYRQKDRQVRRVLRTLSPGDARRVVFYRQIRVDGQLVEITGIDRLAQAVRLRSGRLPRSCTPTSCEVLQIGDRGRAKLHQGDVRLDRVGTADLRDPGMFGYISAAGASPAAPPVLLIAPGVGSIDRLPSLRPFYRVYSWLSPLRADSLKTWDVGRTLAAESRGQTALYAADSSFRLSSPDDELLDATHRGTIAARRLVLVGGETSALLLGFAIIAAIGLRRGLGSERRRLLARGARRWQASLALAAEIGAMTLAGALVGIAVGAAVVAVIAGAAAEPPGAILSHGLLAGWTLGALAGGVLVVTLVLAATTLTRDDEQGRRRIHLFDVAAIGAAAAIVVGLSRGALDPGSVSGGDTFLLLVLPALVCFVVAVVLARLLVPTMRVIERLTRKRSLALRLGVLALARAPSRTVVTCAFITVALGLALFAAAYRATLARGASDQAAFQVPLDYTVSEGSKLVEPLDAAPLSAYDRTAPETDAFPVVRVAATTPGEGTAVLSPTVLGVPAAAIRLMHWRSDFSSLSRSEIAKRLSAQGEPHPRGPRIPAGAGTLSINARLRGADLLAWVVAADPRGRISLLPLGRVRPGEPVTLTARVPRDRPLRILGIELALPESEAFMLAHDAAEGELTAAPSGELSVGPLHAGRRVLTDWREWRLSKDGDVLPHAGGATIRYAFPDTGLHLVFRPAEGTDDRPMPVIVSPDVAKAAGGVGATTVLDFQDTQVDARIVGVASRLPSVPSDTGAFVLADSAWLSTAIDADAPGQGTPSEVWLAAPEGGSLVARALHRPPFSALAVDSRAAIEDRLSGDPLAHATAVALGAAGLVALVLAVLGFWVGVASELHDEKSDFFDLEAQGLPPADMRRQLRIRGVILLALGFTGGLVLAVLLSRLVVSLIRVSGTTGVPEPPLRLDPDWLVAGLGVAAVMLAALLVAEAASLAAFRDSRPERASWSLE